MTINVVEVPQALPAKCYFCGTGEVDRGPYLDFGIDIPDYGVVYACAKDMIAIGNAFGLLDPTSSSDLQRENSELYLQTVELTDRVARLEHALVTLKETGLFNGNPTPSYDGPLALPGSSDVSDADVSAAEESQGELEGSDGTDAEPLELFDYGESGTPESSDDENVGELLTSSSGDDEFDFSV